MENFSFIEAGICFGLKTSSDLQKIYFSANNFSVHGSVLSFILDHFDNYNSFPDNAVLIEKFPDLDLKAKDVSLEYCLDIFRKQLIYRGAREVFLANQKLLPEDPEKAVANIIAGLDTVTVGYSDGLFVYDSGNNIRLQNYLIKKEHRSHGLKILGIPSPLRVINTTGVGLLPGEVWSIYAKTGVGKSWLCTKFTAIAVRYGYKTLFVSAEMPVEQVSLRLDVILGNMGGFKFTHDQLRRGEGLDEEEYKRFLESIKNKNLFICDSIEQTEITLPGLASLIRKHKPSLLVIDGIDLLSSGSSERQVWEKMHSLFYGIKRLCLNNKMVAIVTNQADINKGDDFSPPKKGAVAFGQALIRASDVAFSMARVEGDEKKRQIQWQKNRDGVIPVEGPIFLTWDVNQGIIRQVQVS